MVKILIVEDEQDLARVLSKRLLGEGFEVVSAVDAYQGFSLALKEKPDLAILDLMLPAGGGLSVLSKIRSTYQIRNLPVIVITGSEDVECKDKVMSEGVEAYIQKPYDFEKLKAIINTILQKGIK